MVVSALRYMPLEEETRYQVSVGNTTSAILSFQMLSPREVRFAKKKLEALLNGTKFDFKIVGDRVYLTNR